MLETKATVSCCFWRASWASMRERSAPLRVLSMAVSWALKPPLLAERALLRAELATLLTLTAMAILLEECEAVRGWALQPADKGIIGARLPEFPPPIFSPDFR